MLHRLSLRLHTGPGSLTSISHAVVDPLRNFGFLLNDLSRLYASNFERHAAPLGLTLAQCKLLAYLQRNEGISQSRLALLTDTDAMTLSRLVDRMAADGLVERRPDPTDRRARRLFLCERALPVLGEIWRLSDLARGEAMSGLSLPERNLLMQLMQRLHASLDALNPGAIHDSDLASQLAGHAHRSREAAGLNPLKASP